MCGLVQHGKLSVFSVYASNGTVYTPSNQIRLSWSELRATWPLVTDLSVFSVYASNGRHHHDKFYSNYPD